jgi:hypothetical protein
VTPPLTERELGNGGVHKIGNGTVVAFCVTAAMKGNGEAVDKVEVALIESMGQEFSGSYGLSYFRNPVAAPTTLDDFVGQSGKKMLERDIPPPPKRAAENWKTGLRFLELARSSPSMRTSKSLLFGSRQLHPARPSLRFPNPEGSVHAGARKPSRIVSCLRPARPNLPPMLCGITGVRYRRSRRRGRQLH